MPSTGLRLSAHEPIPAGAGAGDVLQRYPKDRPSLPPAQAMVYEEEYAINRASDGLLYRAVRGMESWMHRRIAAEQVVGNVLELGAGGLNHVDYETTCARYDVVEPIAEIVINSPSYPRVDEYLGGYDEFVELALTGELTYQKILSVAVLEHLTHLPWIVAASALVLEPHGSFHAGIPNEGGALWEVSWRGTTGVAYRLRNKASYVPLMRHEHVNGAEEIEAVIGYFFDDVASAGFPLSGTHTGMYRHIRAIGPKHGVAREFLAANEVPGPLA
jgi:hypothetical protein